MPSLDRQYSFHIHLYNRNVTTTLCVLLNRDGYILTSIVDGTVRKQFEMDLKKAHDQLEILAEERKEAEESLKSKNAEVMLLKDRLQTENA